MKEQNYWQQFLDTGRIEDYLKFKNADCSNDCSMDNFNNHISDIYMGDNPYAGIREVNRDSFKDSAYRGIR